MKTIHTAVKLDYEMASCVLRKVVVQLYKIWRLVRQVNVYSLLYNTFYSDVFKFWKDYSACFYLSPILNLLNRTKHTPLRIWFAREYLKSKYYPKFEEREKWVKQKITKNQNVEPFAIRLAHACKRRGEQLLKSGSGRVWLRWVYHLHCYTHIGMGLILLDFLWLIELLKEKLSLAKLKMVREPEPEVSKMKFH